MGAIVCWCPPHSPRHRSSSRCKWLFCLRDCFCESQTACSESARPSPMSPSSNLFSLEKRRIKLVHALGRMRGLKSLPHCCVHKFSNLYTTVAHYSAVRCPNSTRLCVFPMTLHRNPIIFIAEVGHALAKGMQDSRWTSTPCRGERRLYFWKFNFVAKSFILSSFCSIFNWFTNLSLSLKPTLCTFVNNNSFCVHIKMQISLKSLLQFVLMILWAMLWKMMS